MSDGQEAGPAATKKRSYVKRKDVYKLFKVVDGLRQDATRDGGWTKRSWIDRVRIELRAAGVDDSYITDDALAYNVKQSGVEFKRRESDPASNKNRMHHTSVQVRVVARELRVLCDVVDTLVLELGAKTDGRWPDRESLSKIASGKFRTDEPAEGGDV